MSEPDWEETAALLGAERVVLARPTTPDWSLSAARLRPHDQLYRAVLNGALPSGALASGALASGALASGAVVDTGLLGDPGRRMQAAGITRVVVVEGPEPGTLLIGENPSGVTDDDVRAATATTHATATAPATAADAAAPAGRPGSRHSDDTLARWVAELSSLPGQPLVSPAGATCLARACGADLAVILWAQDGDVTACWGGAESGRQPLDDVDWPLPEERVLSEVLDDLTGRPPVAPWRVVAAQRGPLAVAVSPPPASADALLLVADLMAFDAERSRTTPEGRHQSMLEERVRIAGLIHDGVTQQVSNVVIQLQLLELAAEDPARLRATLQDARQATATALEELRASLYELAPRLSTMQDLLPSLREWCRDYTAQWGIGVTVEVDGDAHPLDPETNMLSYAVVQECLTNVRKHAEADSATVRVGFGTDRLTIVVADDGRGFGDMGEPATPGRRMGLRLLRDRVRSAGGTLEILSRPGAGSEVTVLLPFNSL